MKISIILQDKKHKPKTIFQELQDQCSEQVYVNHFKD